MSPTKLLIEVAAVALLLAPMALAEEIADTDGSRADMRPPAAMNSAEQEPAVTPAPDAVAVEDDTQDVLEPESDSVPASWDATGAAAPAAVEPPETSADELALEAEPAVQTTPPSLGAIGYDSQGRRGRIHIVVTRDTLWDISDAYLGTPWVWPSIWNDNDDIVNPHLIHPGDHIWITPNEMRRVSPEEAAQLLANRPTEGAPAAAEDLAPMSDAPAPELVASPVDRGSVRVSARETAGLITPDQLEASASIVEKVPERILVSQEDGVYIGLGEGEVQPGDQLTIFRTNMKVFDPDTGELLGYHVDFLGWLEVQETYPETSLAKIAMSTSEIGIGDRLLARESLPQEIPIQSPPEDVEGKISFFPNRRVLMGYNDFVYLNRGTLDGLEVGSPLVIYRPGRVAEEPARDESVRVPDYVIADLLVVRAEAQSAVALVMRSKTELALGDRFRGAR